jgi:hypothetical protein
MWVTTGTSVVKFDPEAGRVESSFTTGSAERIAVSEDGQYLYTAVETVNTPVQRYRLDTGARDLDIPGGFVTAMAVLPGQPHSEIIAKAYPSGVALYDNAVQRGVSLPVSVSALHVRRSDGAIFGWGTGAVYQFGAGAQGLKIRRTMPVSSAFSFESRPVWTDELLVDRNGAVFDLNAGTTLGRVPSSGGCVVAAGRNVYTLEPDPDNRGSVTAIVKLHQSSGSANIHVGNSVRAYDDGVPRGVSPEMNDCSQLVAGAAATRLYCSSSGLMYRLDVDASGVRVLDSFRLLPGRGSFGPMVFSGGRIYTTTGLVIEPESRRTVMRVDALGPVAVMDGVVYWLDPGYPAPLNGKVILRSFDAATLQPLATREINVSTTATGRLLPCGKGRLAFQAGNEIYIVHP